MITSIHAPSRFRPFADGPIHGLSFTDERDCLHILSIQSDDPGRGHLHKWLTQAKTRHHSIRFWILLNDRLQQSLLHQDFTHGHDVDQFGEFHDIMDWTHPHP